MSKIGVIHYNFPGFSFEQFLVFAAETGCGFVELHLSDVWDETSSAAPDARVQDVKKLLATHGLRVSALAAHNDFVQQDASAIEREVARMKQVAALSKMLDDEAVVRTEGGAPKDEVAPENWEDAMYECFSRCTGFLEEQGSKLAIDNHGLISNDGDLLISLLNRIDHPQIGSNLDTMNLRWFGHSIEECNRFYKALAPRVLHTHFKDGFDGRENYKGAALGEGEVDLPFALQCLREANYQGVYCAEYEGPEPEGGVGYRRCIEWLKANI
jgi:sugar phosphate isomerase/epimerase